MNTHRRSELVTGKSFQPITYLSFHSCTISRLPHINLKDRLHSTTTNRRDSNVFCDGCFCSKQRENHTFQKGFDVKLDSRCTTTAYEITLHVKWCFGLDFLKQEDMAKCLFSEKLPMWNLGLKSMGPERLSMKCVLKLGEREWTGGGCNYLGSCNPFRT